MDRRSIFKVALGFGIPMGIFYFIGDLLKADQISSEVILRSAIIAIISGCVAGLIFALLIGLLMNSKSAKAATRMETKYGETIHFTTGANHFKGREAVGGRLYLTNQRLYFRSHKWNFNNHELSIRLEDIKNFSRRKTMGLVANGLLVQADMPTPEKFVVQNIDEWIRQLDLVKSDLRVVI